MSSKDSKVTRLVAEIDPRGWDPCYAGYFVLFNRGHFYESHDVLESLWLKCRCGPKDHFYKALIQLAGSFVHLQKNRPGPAMALFRLSRKYLSSYPDSFEGISLAEVRQQIDLWLIWVEEKRGCAKWDLSGVRLAEPTRA